MKSINAMGIPIVFIAIPLLLNIVSISINNLIFNILRQLTNINIYIRLQICIVI